MKRLKKATFWCGNLFSVFLFAYHAQGLKDGDEVCTSGLRDGDGNSECLPIRRCPQMFQLIRGGYRPRNCGGFEGRDPIVCCPRPGPDGGHTGTRKTPAFDNVQSTRAPTSDGKQPIRRPPVKTRAPGETAWKWCNMYQSITCKNHASLEKVVPPLVFAVGGVSAGKDEFPHMAAVGYGDQNDIVWGCGGTLISEYFVLTAAHCLFYSRRGPAKWIRLGTILIQDELRGGFDRVGASLRGQTHPVIERIPHPGYKSPSKYNDLGLLKIGPALEPHVLSTLSRTIHPACLQVKEESFQELVATGWGRLGQGEEPSPDLQKVTLNLLDNSHCNRTFDIEIRTTSQLQKGIDNSLICAGYLRGGKDTCKGDSGGPLQRTNHLGSCMHQVVGITSFGKLCGFEDSPAVYTRVSFFVEWIESHVWPQE